MSEKDDLIEQRFHEPIIRIPKWICEACGCERWVGHRYGPADEGYTRNAQCVDCGHVQEIPAVY